MPSLFDKMLFLWRAVPAFHGVLTRNLLSRYFEKASWMDKSYRVQNRILGFFPSLLPQHRQPCSELCLLDIQAKMFHNHLHWCLCWHCWDNTFWLRTKSLELPSTSMFWQTRTEYNSFLNKHRNPRGLHPACFLPSCHVFKNLPERVQYSLLPKTPRHYSSLLTVFPHLELGRWFLCSVKAVLLPTEYLKTH